MTDGRAGRRAPVIDGSPAPASGAGLGGVAEQGLLRKVQGASASLTMPLSGRASACAPSGIQRPSAWLPDDEEAVAPTDQEADK